VTKLVVDNNHDDDDDDDLTYLQPKLTQSTNVLLCIGVRQRCHQYIPENGQPYYACWPQIASQAVASECDK